MKTTLQFMTERTKTIIQFTILILFAIIFYNLFFLTEISGESMYPTLNNGEYLIGLKDKDESIYKTGDIIIFNVNDLQKILIKRIIGIPGDKLELKNGNTYINDKLIIEDYINNKHTENIKITLGEDQYFVMGDNRQASTDSRDFGPINGNDIIGKSKIRILPFPKNINKGGN